MRKGYFTENLMCALSEEEVDQRGREAALLGVEIEEFKDSSKTIKSKLTADEKEMTQRLYRLGHACKNAQEERPVSCHEVANNARFTVETVRNDTGEVSSTRAMTEEEREKVTTQGNLFVVPTETSANVASLDRQRELKARKNTEAVEPPAPKVAAAAATPEPGPFAPDPDEFIGPAFDDELPPH